MDEFLSKIHIKIMGFLFLVVFQSILLANLQSRLGNKSAFEHHRANNLYHKLFDFNMF